MNLRTHVVLPASLIEEMDRIAGARKRSGFIEAAVREKLSRERLGLRLHDSAGVIDAAHYPEWRTPERISRWVQRTREAGEKRRKRKLRVREAK